MSERWAIQRNSFKLLARISSLSNTIFWRLTCWSLIPYLLRLYRDLFCSYTTLTIYLYRQRRPRSDRLSVRWPCAEAAILLSSLSTARCRGTRLIVATYGVRELSHGAGLTDDTDAVQRRGRLVASAAAEPSAWCNYTKGNYERSRQKLMAAAVELSCMSQFDCRC